MCVCVPVCVCVCVCVYVRERERVCVCIYVGDLQLSGHVRWSKVPPAGFGNAKNAEGAEDNSAGTTPLGDARHIQSRPHSRSKSTLNRDFI
jgi:hypothetical protein